MAGLRFCRVSEVSFPILHPKARRFGSHDGLTLLRNFRRFPLDVSIERPEGADSAVGLSTDVPNPDDALFRRSGNYSVGFSPADPEGPPFRRGTILPTLSIASHRAYPGPIWHWVL